MKKILFVFGLMTLGLGVSAQQKALWIRSNSISPDGQTVAFSYQGDVFTVGIDGGQATQITTNPAHDCDPIWTPDGESIVFSSYREGSRDIWIVGRNGGTPKRLTTMSGNEIPLCVTPDGRIIFKANIQIDPVYAGWCGDYQTYQIKLDGSCMKQYLPMRVDASSMNGKGDFVYENYKGVEDSFRKHHTSSVAHDIFVRKADGSFSKLSDYVGNNLNPVFAPDGNVFYFLCEQGGTLNIWKSSLQNPQSKTQVTFFEKNPVRYISVAGNGTICCSYNGKLYIIEEGALPRKLEISVKKDKLEKEKVYMTASSANQIAGSPEGKEVAVISRGDVYVTSEEYKTTRRITYTPEQERDVCFGKDGRTIYYSSERDGEWGIYRTELRNKEDKLFTYAYEFKEERVTPAGQTCFQPSVSPDGEWLAYLRDRTDVVIRNIRNGKEKVLLQGVNYSYSDGDQELKWCPDSRHIACTYMVDGGWNNTDVAVIDIDSAEIHNVTQSGYNNYGIQWVMGGKAITWTSDKMGYRSHGSWGSERDIYIEFLDKETFKKFYPDEELEKVFKEKGKEKEKKSESDSLKKEKIEKLKLDFDNLEDRTVRLTPGSGQIVDYYLSNDGKKLFYNCRSVEGSGIYKIDIKDGSLKLLKKGAFGGFTATPDGEAFFVKGLLGVSKFNVGSESTTSISFSGEYEYDQYAERSYIFEHCWKQVNDKFYDSQIHGVDWKYFHDNYAQFLPYINNNFDFQEMLSEMLGELNGSHTGARYSPFSRTSTGHLGVLFDTEYCGEGLRVQEILPGSVLLDEYPELKEGDIILAIDGVKIPQGCQWWEAFDRKAGKRLMLTIKCPSKDKNVYVKTTSSDTEALYKRWVRRNEQIVYELSGGRIGYVHVKGMNSPSFREVFSKALGKYRGCEALIVDSRNNSGGWLTDDLISLFSGKRYVDYTPRDRYIGSGPYDRWTKPTCLLVGENNYSDASAFPYAYRANGLGKLIGAPVPGTMTAVWWETQIDPSLVFGIPQVTCRGLDGNPIENHQIEPDILVYNTPETLINGRDIQLETAVKELLSQIETR